MHAQQMLIWAAGPQALEGLWPQALPLSQEALLSNPICGFCRGKGTVLSNGTGQATFARASQIVSALGTCVQPVLIAAKALQPLAG